MYPNVNSIIVKRTITLLLNLSDEDKSKLLETMEAFTVAYKISAKWGFENKTWNKISNHRGTYSLIRNVVPNLPSGLVQAARDVACENLKRLKNRMVPNRKKYSAMRFNKNVIRFCLNHNIVSISTVRGRIKTGLEIPECFNKYLDWRILSSIIKYEKSRKRFFVGIVIEKRTPEPILEGEVIGIDRGLVNLAVCSNNIFFNSSQIKNVRGRFRKTRAELQAKGTRSARRKLRVIAGRERRFTAWVNHRISKEIASMPYNLFALEDLVGINEKVCGNKSLRRKLSVWPYRSFEQMLIYKTEELGKVVLFVDPENTSKRCSKCGHIAKANRKGPEFECKKCGYCLNPDLNASRNIALSGRSGLGRLLAHKPNASSDEEGMGSIGSELRCEPFDVRKVVSPRCFGIFDDGDNFSEYGEVVIM
jgi:putative transposase